jgi:hypothetical protein
MSTINRWFGIFVGVLVLLMLSACSSIDHSQLTVDSTKYNTAFIETNSGVQSTIPASQTKVDDSNPQSVPEIDALNKEVQAQFDLDDKILALTLSDKFKRPVDMIQEIIKLADTYSYADFPKRNDILAIIAVESSFNPKARCRGSYGLMQLQYKSHRQDLAGTSVYNVERNIAVGAAELRQYYLMLNNDSKGAVLAYNIGIGSFIKGHHKSVYYHKYQAQRAYLDTIT